MYTFVGFFCPKSKAMGPPEVSSSKWPFGKAKVSCWQKFHKKVPKNPIVFWFVCKKIIRNHQSYNFQSWTKMKIRRCFKSFLSQVLLLIFQVCGNPLHFRILISSNPLTVTRPRLTTFGQETVKLLKLSAQHAHWYHQHQRNWHRPKNLNLFDDFGIVGSPKSPQKTSLWTL